VISVLEFHQVNQHPIGPAGRRVEGAAARRDQIADCFTHFPLASRSRAIRTTSGRCAGFRPNRPFLHFELPVFGDNVCAVSGSFDAFSASFMGS
jgi:hypothetical protein